MSFNSRLVFFTNMSHIYWILISLTWYHLMPNTFSQVQVTGTATKNYACGYPDLKIQYGLKIMPVSTQISCLQIPKPDLNLISLSLSLSKSIILSQKLFHSNHYFLLQEQQLTGLQVRLLSLPKKIIYIKYDIFILRNH